MDKLGKSSLSKGEVVLSSNLSRGYQSFADMMELVYISDLKSEFSEFESRYPHHTAFVQWIGHGSSKARMRVRFLHAVPEL